MFPYPFEKFVPDILRNNLTAKGQAFIDKHDEYILAWIEELKELYFANKLPERIPLDFLEEMGYFLNAGLMQTDTETIKRKKIADAVKSHKLRGTWNDDAKIRIDNITGYNAAIFVATQSDDSIEMGQTSSEDATVYWSTESGYDGADDSLGTWEIGDFTEYVIAGNVYIDCHEGVNTAVLTSDQIEQIVVELEFDVVPAYMKVYLGYINTLGQFIVYTGGIIE